MFPDAVVSPFMTNALALTVSPEIFPETVKESKLPTEVIFG